MHFYGRRRLTLPSRGCPKGCAFCAPLMSNVGRLESLDYYAPWAYSLAMLTVVETMLFQRQWPLYWTEEERGAFAAYIAERPTAGDVVPESGGIRKVRWGRAGSGKSGGVRVIYFTRTAEGEVVLLTLYAKAKTDNLTGPKLKEIRRALEE
jgi:hypothetical protein